MAVKKKKKKNGGTYNFAAGSPGGGGGGGWGGRGRGTDFVRKTEPVRTWLRGLKRDGRQAA